MPFPAPDLSIYLHIPFCSVRCTYCAFNIYANLERLIPAYVDALCAELRVLGPQADKRVHTVYFGGGTPSLLTPAQVGQILMAIRESFTVCDAPEISFEVNPEALPTGYFEALRALGVNRLSIGMQSVHADELALFGRLHTPQDTARTVAAARGAGFDNLSLDLIYGVPNQTLEKWEASVRAALDLMPEHLSLYGLQVEDGTAFAKWIERGRLPTPDDDLAADMYDAADALISDAGLAQYEISTWARLGCEARHNLQYWQYGDYLGVGVGAHGFVHGLRYSVIRSPQQYIKRVAAGAGTRYPRTASTDTMEPISADQAMDEVMITGLRVLREGVDQEAFRARFGLSIAEVYGPALERLAGLGMLDVTPEAVRLTRPARLISNQVLVHFTREIPSPANP